MKIELQSKNIEKDYIFGHHFSFWSEYAAMIKGESNYKKKRKMQIILLSFNVSAALLVISFLFYFGKPFKQP